MRRILKIWFVISISTIALSSFKPVIHNLTASAIETAEEKNWNYTESSTYTPNPALVNKIKNYFESRVKTHSFNGAVLYAENGNIVYKKAFGYADIRNKKKLSLDDPMQLASVSKPITSTAALLLVQDKKLSLDDTVDKFFPEFPYKNISIKNLLSQRSGLAEYLYFSEKHWESRKKTINNDDVLDIIYKHKPANYYKPDYRYNYVNTNFMLLASIIEKVSQQSFDEFVKENIFVPLDMHDSFVYVKDKTEKPENTTYGHDNRKYRVQDSYFNGVVGDKGIYSTVSDLLKFDQALYTDKLLNTEMKKIAFTAVHKDLKKTDNYGLGWRISEREQGTVVYHSGWWNGYKTHFIRLVDENKTAIVLTNCTRGGFLQNTTLRKLISDY